MVLFFPFTHVRCWDAISLHVGCAQGSFGQVCSCIDTKTGNKTAVKVIKNKEAFRRQARTEIRLLKMLNDKDPSDQWCIVRFEETFQHNGHTCLVFEHLSFNLYELLKVRDVIIAAGDAVFLSPGCFADAL